MLMSTRFLIPVLFLVSVLALTACGGSKTDPIADATKAAATPPSTSFDLVAKGTKFKQSVLVATAGAEITVRLDNQDGGTSHNFALYTNKGAKEKLYAGELFEGKKTVENKFKAPAAGIYYFRCDAHPDSMAGTFIAR